jgi:hypothetical protein
MPGGRWSGLVRYGLPGLVLGLVLASGGRGGGRELWAQAEVPIPAPVPVAQPGSGPLPGPAPAADRGRASVTSGGEASGTIAFTTSAYGPVQFLYLIDTRSRAFVIYRVDSTNTNKGVVKLEAARQYGGDLKLTEYNNFGVSVTAVEAMAQEMARSRPQRTSR